MVWLRTGASAIALLAFISAAQAGTELVTNGSFEQTNPAGFSGQFTTQVTGWSTQGYNFLFTPGSADTTGVTGQYGNLKLWGPGDGSANGLTATSPNGGNFIGADGAYSVGAITQTINNLVAGQQYAVSFDWAGAQQKGYDGGTTEAWKVSFGGRQTQETAIVNNASHGFTGWMRQTFVFTADSTSDLLSFLAVGTPAGVPPFSLLDGVSVQAVPEPATLTLIGAGLVAIGGLRLRRRNRA